MANFTVTLPVKSYIKIFLEANCGAPVDLAKLPGLKLNFRRYLKKPSIRHDYKYENLPRIYKDTVAIIITEDDFYRYGWELTKTDIINFGKEIESIAKFFMRNMVGLDLCSGLPIKKSIEKFQATYGFSENDWSYETLKKDFYRNGEHLSVDFKNEISNKLQNIIMENLSLLGTISHKFKTQYEST
jgi:hypothetical protein